MQDGECPYADCDDYQLRLLPDVALPKFSKEKCPGCNRMIWLFYSRVEPQAFTPEEFEREYILDEDTKSVKRRKAA